MTPESYWTNFQQAVNAAATVESRLGGYEVVMAGLLSDSTDQVQVPAEVVSRVTHTRLDQISREILDGTCTCAGVLLYLKNRQGGVLTITFAAKGDRYALSIEEKEE